MNEYQLNQRDALKWTGTVAVGTGLVSQSATTQSEAVGPAISIESHDNGVYALDAGTGQQEWTLTQFSCSLKSSPTTVDDISYAKSYVETLHVTNNLRYAHEN